MLLTYVARSSFIAKTEPTTAAPATVDTDVRDHVWNMLSVAYPSPQGAERRNDRRYPFPQLLHLTPVTEAGANSADECIVVPGKHISERGIGFFHREPLPFRRVITSIEFGGRWSAFLTDLSWCRFTHHGWYESGGRFIQVVPSPLRDMPSRS